MLNLKSVALQDETIISREGSNEQIRLFLGNSQTPRGQVQLSLDMPKKYKISRFPFLYKNFKRAYTPHLMKEGGEPLIFCRKNPLWTTNLYREGISNLCLDSEDVGILYLGKKGCIGKNLQINVFAPNFEVLGYNVLQDSNALKYPEVKELRKIVDDKNFERIRRAA